MQKVEGSSPFSRFREVPDYQCTEALTVSDAFYAVLKHHAVKALFGNPGSEGERIACRQTTVMAQLLQGELLALVGEGDIGRRGCASITSAGIEVGVTVPVPRASPTPRF